jgi:NADPH:quinone reductase-like Zn-dependent oxidoreductase
MKAIYLERKGGPESLVAGEIPRPSPQAGEVLIRVHATSIMPTELEWDPTFHQRTGEPRPFPIVLSHEFSGVVESVGPGVAGFGAGDEVHGINDWYANGAQAEYCVAAATSLAPKPRSLKHTESAVVPISALTAWQGLFEKTQLERKQRVLIHGAAGGVGAFAVQFARWRGAQVTATASAANVEFVRALGADQVIDYHTTRFEEVICDVDVVFDGVGGDTLKRYWGVLKEKGKLVTIVSGQDAADRRAQEAFFIVRADGPQLAQIGRMIDAGEIRVFLGAVYPLADARDAYARAEQGNLRGKIALSVVEDETINYRAGNEQSTVEV